MPYAYPQWRGFERAPEGHLLDQVIDLSGPMGIAYERGVGFRKDFHVHDRPMIVLPRGSCVIKVRTVGDLTETHTISSAAAFIVPSRVEHEDEAVSSIFDTLALYPAPSLITAVADDEGIPEATVARFMNRPRELPRSPWLEQLAREYVLARIVSRRESPKTLAFFERQMLVEILASSLRRRRAVDSPAPPAGDTVTGWSKAEPNPWVTWPYSWGTRVSRHSPGTSERRPPRSGHGREPPPLPHQLLGPDADQPELRLARGFAVVEER